MDEEYGGTGVKDFRYNMVLAEEISPVGASGLGLPGAHRHHRPLHHLARDRRAEAALAARLRQRRAHHRDRDDRARRRLDLQGIKTSAVDKGDHYVLNGSKTFISNGIMADLVIVVARTDPDAGHQGISLLVVERGMAGFERGRNLDKVGCKAQDTAELFFDNVEVPEGEPPRRGGPAASSR